MSVQQQNLSSTQEIYKKISKFVPEAEWKIHAPLIERINRDLESKLKLDPSMFTVTGILILYNNMLQSLFNSQILSLGFVMLGITIMFLVLFKSFTLYSNFLNRLQSFRVPLPLPMAHIEPPTAVEPQSRPGERVLPMSSNFRCCYSDSHHLPPP